MYLEIIQNEKSGLITYEFMFPQDSITYYLQSLLEKYVPEDYPETFKQLYKIFF